MTPPQTPPTLEPVQRVPRPLGNASLRGIQYLFGLGRGARTGKLFVISGPSGGGKTTVVRELLRRMPKLRRSVSVTTRPRRAAERHGAHYQFISKERFAQLRRQGALAEWARVHRAHYGTPNRPVRRALSRGEDVILSLDVQGAKQIRRTFGRQAVLVFLLPPSFGHLKRRLIKRRTETPEAVRQRLVAAEREVACAAWYDYVVVNQRLRAAVDQLKAIVTAERLRTEQGGKHGERSH